MQVQVRLQECSGKVRPWSRLAARSISTLPGQDASPSQVASQQFVRFLQQFTSIHLYSWVERGIVKVQYLEHNTLLLARVRTWTARSRDKRTNHKATRLPQGYKSWSKKSCPEHALTVCTVVIACICFKVGHYVCKTQNYNSKQ